MLTISTTIARVLAIRGWEIALYIDGKLESWFEIRPASRRKMRKVFNDLLARNSREGKVTFAI